MLNLEFLKKSAEKVGFLINEQQLNKLDVYASLLVEWNQKMNLTSIIEPDEIVIKHYIDSFLLLNHINRDEKLDIIDVGTGAGFPSLPCKIINDNLNLTMLDSVNKRINFLNEVVKETGINAECVHSRAEDAGNNFVYREKYDIATARAVAHLRELSEYCLPFVKKGGYFIALKGYEIEDEINEAKAAIYKMGGKIIDIKKYELEDTSKRAMVIIKKISQTPTKYPRSYAKMKKEPIK